MRCKPLAPRRYFAATRRRPTPYTPAATALLSGATASPGATLLDRYLIVNAVEGLAPGACRYRREARSLELLRLGGAASGK